MCEGGAAPFEGGRAAGDPAPGIDRTKALRERLFGNALGALELYTIYLGERLGCIGHSQKAVQPPRRSWPYALEPPNGTCGSGWSTMPRVSCSRSTTRGPNHS